MREWWFPYTLLLICLVAGGVVGLSFRVHSLEERMNAVDVAHQVLPK